MIFQHTNHKELMVIHNLQTEFRLLIAIVYTTDSKNISICRQVTRLDRHFHGL